MSTDECECYDKCSKQRCRGSHWLQAWQAQQQRLLTQLPIQHKVSLSMVVVLLLVAVFTLRSLQLETWRGRGVLRFKVPDAVFERAEMQKTLMQKSSMFQNMSVDAMHQQLPVWVISLARATARRQHIKQQMAAAGVANYELVDAADYRNESSYTQAELHKYTHGWRRHMWDKGQPLVRSKVAIDLSHFRLLERVARTGRPAIILEDDAQLNMTGKQWLPNLLTALQELPRDWDILYLNSIFTNKGAQVSPHLVAVRWTPSAIGYIPTPAFARKVLANARSRGYSTWIDVIFEQMERHCEAQAYLVQPPLVQYAQLGTTAAYSVTDMNYTWWERIWYLNKVARRLQQV